jgi:DeoR family suf operon transcriptional repressor
MHDTRLQVLDAIRTQRQATVDSLVEALGLTHISIRHHLANLKADGLIDVRVDRQGVGRPKHIYTLTDAAQRYLPTKYFNLAERLMDELKAALPAETVTTIINDLAANVVARYGEIPESSTIEERLKHLVGVLDQEGFTVEVRHNGNQTLIAGTNCPYLHIGQRHPEVCRLDQGLIESLLGVNVQKQSCVLEGGHSCTFAVDNVRNHEV